MALSNLRNLIGYVTEEECTVLWKYALASEHACMNIGTFQGKSAIAMALSGSDTYSVDKHSYRLYEKNKKDFEVTITDLPVDNDWDEPIGLLFIDGSHFFDEVLDDYKKYEPHVVSGGILIFHDYDFNKNEEVWAVIKHLKDELEEKFVEEQRIGRCLVLRKK